MIDNALFNRYEGLIFDMDGTLIDTMPVHARAWDIVGEQFGYEFDSQIMYQLGGATVRTIASAIMQKAGMPQTRLDEVIAAKRALSYQLIPTESKLLPTFDIRRKHHVVADCNPPVIQHHTMVVREEVFPHFDINAVIASKRRINGRSFVRLCE